MFVGQQFMESKIGFKHKPHVYMDHWIHFLHRKHPQIHRKLHKWPEKVTQYSVNMQSHHIQPYTLWKDRQSYTANGRNVRKLRISEDTYVDQHQGKGCTPIWPVNCKLNIKIFLNFEVYQQKLQDCWRSFLTTWAKIY